MIRVTCDLCGKEILRGEESHYVVKIEVFAAPDQEALTESDLAVDNLEAVSELLKAQESGELDLDELSERQELRYDLCTCCRDKFVKSPLRPDAAANFEFSQN